MKCGNLLKWELAYSMDRQKILKNDRLICFESLSTSIVIEIKV